MDEVLGEVDPDVELVEGHGCWSGPGAGSTSQDEFPKSVAVMPVVFEGLGPLSLLRDSDRRVVAVPFLEHFSDFADPLRGVSRTERFGNVALRCRPMG